MTFEVSSLRRQPEVVAGVVNALLVLLLPVGLCVAAWVGLWFDNSARVSASSRTVRVLVNLFQMGILVEAFLPLAVVAGWRTWAHARRYRARQGTGWQGVAEAGAVGLFIAIWILRYGIVTRPAEAPPYIIVYGGAALILGLAIGLILRMTAILTLKRTSRGHLSHD